MREHAKHLIVELFLSLSFFSQHLAIKLAVRRLCCFQVHTLFGVTEIVVALSLVCQRDKLGSPEMQRGVEDAQKNQINKNRDEGQRREQVVSTDPDCRTVGIQVSQTRLGI